MLRSGYDIVQNQKKIEKRISLGKCVCRWVKALGGEGLNDDEIGAVGDFGGGEDPKIAGSLLLRCDGINKSLKGAERAACYAKKPVMIERGLNGKGGFINDRQPSPAW